MKIGAAMLRRRIAETESWKWREQPKLSLGGLFPGFSPLASALA